MAEISVTRLKEVLHYDPETGIFTWIKSLNARAPVGATVNNLSSDGYIRVRIDKELYYAHRLAFLYMTGSFPKEQVDHINHIRTDNRWEILKAATHHENGLNQKLQPNNKTGLPGVFWDNSHNYWVSYIKYKGKTSYLKCTKDFFEACCYRKSAEIMFGFHENHGSRL